MAPRCGWTATARAGLQSDYNLFHLTERRGPGVVGGSRVCRPHRLVLRDRLRPHSLTATRSSSTSTVPTASMAGTAVSLSAQVIDDEDAGHAFTGTWTENTHQGLRRATSGSPTGDGSSDVDLDLQRLAGRLLPHCRDLALRQHPAPRPATPATPSTMAPAHRWPTATASASTTTPCPTTSAPTVRPGRPGLARLEGDTLVVEAGPTTPTARCWPMRCASSATWATLAPTTTTTCRPGSPALDRGSLNDYWLHEPQANGGAASILGAYGNTAKPRPARTR